VKLTIDNSTCLLQASVKYEIEVLAELDEEFAIEIPNHWFSPRFRKGDWDGKYHAVRIRGTAGRFETGFLGEVLDFLKERKVKLSIAEKRVTPDTEKMLSKIQPKMLKPVRKFRKLRKYQLKATRRVVKNQRGILALATNTGKTAIAAAALKAIDLPALHLAPNKDVLFQTQKDFHEFLGEPIGSAVEGKLVEEKIVVGLPQTATKFKKYLKKVGAIIVDECQHMRANLWYNIVKACKNAPFRIGLSGTPYGDDIAERKLTGATGPIIYTISNKFMIKKGYSAEPIILFLKIEQPEIEYLSYEKAYKQGIVQSIARNQRIVEMCVAAEEKQKLILVFEMEHGKRLLKLLSNQDIAAQFIHGSETMETRTKAKQRFKAGKLKTLIASTIFDEGVDIPNIEILIIASGWKTPMRFLQRVGRAMRQKEGKANIVIVADFLDLSNFYLLTHSYERYQTAKAEGFRIEVEK